MDIIGLSGMSRGAGGDAAAGGERESDPQIKYEGVLALSRFEHGQLAELRLHPVELTDQNVRLVNRGIPRLASPEAARRILTRLQKLSRPLGTDITIENNIGIVRPRMSTSRQ